MNTLSKRTELDDWMRAMVLSIEKHYTKVCHLFHYDKRPITDAIRTERETEADAYANRCTAIIEPPPPVVEATASEADKRFYFETMNDRRERIKDKSEAQEVARQCRAHILGSLSKDLLVLVEGAGGYEESINEFNLGKLWNIIINTLKPEGVAKNALAAEALLNYYRLRMRDDERISEFNVRYNEASKSISTENLPLDGVQIIIYASMLNSKYTALRNYLNNTNVGSLSKAMDLAINWAVENRQFKIAAISTETNVYDEGFNNGNCTLIAAVKENTKEVRKSPDKTATTLEANKPSDKTVKYNKRKIKCLRCGNRGHIARYCRAIIPDEQINSAYHDNREFDNAFDGIYLIDSAASSHLFHDKKYVERNSKESVRAIGIGGATKCTRGKHQLFGKCLISNHTPFNLVSLAKLKREGFKVIYDHDLMSFNVTKENVCNVNFKLKNNLFQARLVKSRLARSNNIHTFWTNGEESNINETEIIAFNKTNGRMFSNEQRRRAELARRIHMALGHPGNSRLGEMLRKNGINNINITENDLLLADLILGRCESCIKGKMVSRQAKVADFTKTTTIGETLHADIMYLYDMSFLVAVDEATGYIIITKLQSKSAREIVNDLISMINHFKSFGRNVKYVRCDRESAFMSEFVANGLGAYGVSLRLSDTRGHDAIVERSIRIIKERCISMMQDIKWSIPDMLIPHLVRFACNSINLICNNKTAGISVITLVTGRNVTAHDVEFAFGDIALAKTPYRSRSHQPKADIVIIIGRDMRSSKSKLVFNVETGGVEYRSNLVSIKLNNEILTKINKFKSTIINVNQENNTVQPIVQTLEVSNQQAAASQEINTIEAASGGQLEVTSDPHNDFDDAHDFSQEFIRSEEEEKQGGEPAKTIQRQHADMEVKTSIQERSALNLDKSNEIAEDITVNDTQTTTNEKSWIEEQQQGDDQSIHTTNSLAQTSVTSNTTATEKAQQQDEVPISKKTPTPRKSSRQRTKIKLYVPGESNTEATQFMIESDDLANVFPEWCMMTYHQATKDNPVETKKGLVSEINQHIENGTYQHIEKSQIGDSYVIPSIAVAAKKRDNTIKVRLVANGAKQNTDSLTFEDISSPTLKTQSLMILLAIAVTKSLNVSAYDIKGAYLKAKIKSDKDIVIRFNKEITSVMREIDSTIPTDTQGASYAVLRKALYGLRQSGKLFYSHLLTTLSKLGYDTLNYDRCVFRRCIGARYCYIAIYVDDIIIFTDDENERMRIKKGLTEIYGDLKQQKGSHITYRGIEIYQRKNSIFINQEPYVTQLCKQFNIVKSVTTPTTANLFEIDEHAAPADDSIAFRNGVAKILWLASQTRPDVRLLASFLSTRLANPSKQDELKLIRGLKYLHGTSSLGMQFTPCSLVLNASIDASHMVHPDAHGHTGVHIRIGTNLVEAISKKQTIIAQSSAEAELIGLNHGLNHLSWAQNLMEELGFEQLESIVYQDNLSTIAISEGGYPTQRTKHMAMRYFHVKELINQNKIKLKYLASEHMDADIQTKSLERSTFQKHRDEIMGRREEAN